MPLEPAQNPTRVSLTMDAGGAPAAGTLVHTFSCVELGHASLWSMSPGPTPGTVAEPELHAERAPTQINQGGNLTARTGAGEGSFVRVDMDLLQRARMQSASPWSVTELPARRPAIGVDR